MSINHALYDQQAPVFDQRVGLTQPRCEQIVTAIEQLSGFERQATLVEMGCGTGELGSLLAARFADYIGIDLSLAMLKQTKVHHQAQNIPLVQADGSKTWPVADHQADIIFSSRAIHWINSVHTVYEIVRIANKANAMFIIGRVERSRDSWEAQLRQQCHQLLKHEGLTPLNGGQHLKQLCNQFRECGAEILPSQTVYHWHQPRTYQQSLEDWADKPGLAGTTLSQAAKQKILTSLNKWAIEHFGSHLPTQAERHYVLYPINLRSR